jgi:hypothetical protein
LVKMGWIAASTVDGAAVVIGHLPAGLRPGGLGQPQVPAIERKPNVSRIGRSHHVTIPQGTADVGYQRYAPDRIFVFNNVTMCLRESIQIILFCVSPSAD